MPTHHAHGGSGDPANRSSTNEPASLNPQRSIPPPAFPLTEPGTQIRNPSLSYPQSSSDEDEDSPAAYPQSRTSNAPYTPRYAAAAHSYYPGDPSSFQHMQARYQTYDPERQHPPPLYDHYNRPGSYPHDRPLIHFVTNEWQNNPRYHDNSDDDDYYSSDEERFYSSMNKEGWVPDDIVNRLPTIRIPRRVQRWLLIYFVVIVACWFGWLYWIAPAMEEEKRLDDAFAAAEKKGNKFGSNVRPNFADMTQIKTLPEHLIPGDGKTDRRLIFIGDVHGCKDELVALLDKTRYNAEKDHIVFTGDIIAKGPDSLGVVDLARSLNASCVRGNHEDRMLLAWQGLHSKMHPIPYDDDGSSHDAKEASKDTDKLKDDREEGSGSRGDYKERLLARQFSPEQISYLQSCPVVLRIPLPKRLQGTAGEYVVAHAGLVPGVDMDRQDPFQVMNMRTIDLVSRVPSELSIFEPWETIWGHAMGHVHPLEQRIVVVYGHDAKRGLNVKKYSKGLDSACVRRGRLTALVVDGWGRERVVSVRCGVWKKEKER